MTPQFLGLALAAATVLVVAWAVWRGARVERGAAGRELAEIGVASDAAAVVRLLPVDVRAFDNDAPEVIALERRYGDIISRARAVLGNGERSLCDRELRKCAEDIARLVDEAREVVKRHPDVLTPEFELGLLINRVELAYASPDARRNLGLVSGAIEAAETADRFLAHGNNPSDRARVALMGAALKLWAADTFSDDARVLEAAQDVASCVASTRELQLAQATALVDVLARRDLTVLGDELTSARFDPSWRKMLPRVLAIDDACEERLTLEARVMWHLFREERLSGHLERAVSLFRRTDLATQPAIVALEGAQAMARYAAMFEDAAAAREAAAAFAPMLERGEEDDRLLGFAWHLAGMAACLQGRRSVAMGSAGRDLIVQARVHRDAWLAEHPGMETARAVDAVAWCEAAIDLADASDMERGDVDAAVRGCELLLARPAELGSLDRVRVAERLGALLARQRSDDAAPRRQALERALSIYEMALDQLERGGAPFRWAKLKVALGDVAARLASETGEAQHYRDAAQAYEAAISVFTIRNGAQPRLETLLKLGGLLQNEARALRARCSPGMLYAGRDGRNPSEIMASAVRCFRAAHDLSALDGLDGREPECRERLERAEKLAHSL